MATAFLYIPYRDNDTSISKRLLSGYCRLANHTYRLQTIYIEYTLNIIEQSLQDILKNGGLNGGLNLLQQEIISLIRDNPYIKTFDIAQKLKRPVRTIENNLRILREKAIIGRQGSKKSGRWIVNQSL